MYSGTLIEDLTKTVDKAGTKVPMIPMGLTVSPELYDSIRNTTKECGSTLSEFCRVAIKFYIEHLEKESVL